MTTPRQRVTVDEAARLITAAMPRWPAVRVPLAAATNCVLRENIVTERDQPPFDRVTMDGIAFAQRDLATHAGGLRVAGTQAAGAPALRLPEAGTCVEIMTGSALPEGADTIVPVERIRRDGVHARIEQGYEARAGQFIHRQGSDHRAGATLLTAGTIIGPTEMAVLTVSGKADVAIGRPPRIAAISTGDELVDAGAPIERWQIRSSNDRAVEAALRGRGLATIGRAMLPDDPAVLEREIGRLYAANDVLILSGGVSMGQFDHIPRVLTALGVEAVFHKITQRPGLPMWFGMGNGKPVFALPGNPVSSLVCLTRYVLPAVFHGLGASAKPQPRVRLASPVDFAADLTWFLAVILQYTDDGEVLAVPKPTNTSGDFIALAGTDGFVELPRGRDHFPAGFVADFYHW